ncbi:type 2 lanthipeptide synthetase LanM [Streptomyces sp. NBC_01476]|uniref:type 2 lanthipeptide synthetase LanM n=1 Tax=Streptomyces sp. NBC_01476 TaxID=2903881 RepID=UPI002E341C10|nr:type 2 lanthipeptide synthetase LanM [Streptomyces sp. NBC_01476]
MTLDIEAWMPAAGAASPGSSHPGGQLLPDLHRGDERLRAVVAAAAAFPDRAAAGPHTDGSLFTAEPPEDRAADNSVLRTWLQRAAGDPHSAGVLLDHLAATDRPLGTGLRKVTLRDPERLPDWAQSLTAFLRAQPAGPDASTAAAGALTASFRRAADALLPAPYGRVLGVPVDPAALEQIAGTLVARLAEACRLSFCHELQAATGLIGADDWNGHSGLDASAQGWLARLERLPGLAYLVGVVCRNWQRVTLEMFARLAADRAMLSERLWDGEDPGALTSVRGDAGDRHAGGHSVALLHFATGRAVVYKPKDMRHGTAYMDLVGHLNRYAAAHPDSGLLDLHIRTVLPRSDHGDEGLGGALAADCGSEYGWEELVPADPSADRAGFARFYRRLGMTIRLMQLLEGRDLWADNLLASGEHPVITDLECLLYPRVRTPPALPAGQGGLLDLLETTVVRTAMAAQPWVAAKDQPALDIGCLTRAGGWDGDPDAPTLPLPPYRPVHQGETADPWQYTDEVVDGYRAMQRALYAMRDELADEDGPLAGFRGVWVRYIWRHTWDGYKILNASSSPLALTDGATRETVIAGALRGAVAARAGDPARDDLLEVVLSELDSFRELDIPFFRSLTTSSSVFTVNGREIPGHFQSTGWRRLMGRVAELDGYDLDWHTAVLTGCLDAALGGSEQRATPPFDAAGFALPGRGELLAEAVRLGDRILADRHVTASGSGWIGQSWYPLTGLRQVEVLGGVDLLTSGVGVALFLAELWTATGEPRFRRAAHETLTAAGALVDPGAPHAFAFATDGRLALGAPVPGGLAGPGALIHALARGAQLLDEPGFLAQARALVPGALALARTAAGGRAVRPAPAPYQDVPLGTAGLLLNLLRLRQALPEPDAATDDGIRELAAAAHDQLAGSPSHRHCTGATRFLDLVPAGPDSLAAALARTLGEAPELLARPEAVRERVRAHRFAITRSGRLSCLDVAVSLGTDALDSVQLGLLAAPVGEEQVATLGTRELVATAGEALTAAELGLVHSLPEDARALLPGPFYDGREAATALVGELLRRRAVTGSWYGDRAASDRINLGVLDGAPAIGLLLLRLLDPSTTPLPTLR